MFANASVADGDKILLLPTHNYVPGTTAGTLEAICGDSRVDAPASGVVIPFTMSGVLSKPNISLAASGDNPMVLSAWEAYRVTTTLSPTPAGSGVEQSAQDTGLNNGTTYYYIAEVTDANGNITWSSVVSTTTDVPVATMQDPSATPTTGTASASLALTVTQNDTNCKTTYTVGASPADPVFGDTDASGGTITLTAPLSSAYVKLRNFETGGGGRTQSDVVTYGPYTVTAVPSTGPLCTSFPITVIENSDTNAIDYLTLGSCSDPGGFTFSLKSVNSVAIVENPQVIPTTNGSVTVLDGDIFYTPTTDYIGTDAFPFILTNGPYDSSAATITVTVSAPSTDLPTDNPEVVTNKSLSGSQGTTTVTGRLIDAFNLLSVPGIYSSTFVITSQSGDGTLEISLNEEDVYEYTWTFPASNSLKVGFATLTLSTPGYDDEVFNFCQIVAGTAPNVRGVKRLGRRV